MLAMESICGISRWARDSTASPITYAVDGKQYVAIASATAIFSFGLFEPAQSVPVPKITRK